MAGTTSAPLEFKGLEGWLMDTTFLKIRDFAIH